MYQIDIEGYGLIINYFSNSHPNIKLTTSIFINFLYIICIMLQNSTITEPTLSRDRICKTLLEEQPMTF